MTGGLVALVVVVGVALLLRARGVREKRSRGMLTKPAARPRLEQAQEKRGAGRDRLVLAVTSDGFAFVPDHHVVRVLPPPEEGEEWKVGAKLKAALETVAMGQGWSPGDIRGVRVVRGEFEEGPWRLEALGRDGEYMQYGFETPEEARAAKELLERLGIVELGHDEEGRPMPPSAEQFAEGRRIYLETAAQLELPDDEAGERQEGRP